MTFAMQSMRFSMTWNVSSGVATHEQTTPVGTFLVLFPPGQSRPWSLASKILEGLAGSVRLSQLQKGGG